MYKVEFCVPLYNRANDIKLLLKNIDSMYHYFKKHNILLSLSVADFNSTDIDLDYEISKFSYPITKFNLEGTFNICIALQKCTDNVLDPDTILCLIDADTCFTEKSYDLMIFHIKDVLEKNVSFIDCMTAMENQHRKIIHTTRDHHGGGIFLVYNDDFKKSNGFKDSPYMNERGTLHGGHDTYYETMLINYGLKMYRPVNNDTFLRFHSRNKTNNVWYVGATYSGPTHLWIDKDVKKTKDKGIDVYYKENISLILA